jgi:hypothetical protein
MFADGLLVAQIIRPALWDRKAINANIISPTLRLDFNEIDGMTAAYAMSCYSQPIDRQASISNFHGNFTLGTDFLIAIKCAKMI